MNKGLEALERLENDYNLKHYTVCNIIKKELERLGEIDDILNTGGGIWAEGGFVSNKLKALEIVKKKRVDVSYLLCVFENDSKCKNYEGLHAYNSFAYHIDLTEQEFDLLKEVLL